MATTFDRILTSMKQADNQDRWASINELADFIRQKKLTHFRIKKEGTSIEDYMSLRSIRAILELSKDFGLLREINGGISLSAEAKASINSADQFSKHLFSLLKTYLDKKNVSLEDIADYIKKIKLPEVPNPQTIYEKIKDPSLSFELFRKILYLLSNVDGIERQVKVFYSQ